MLRIRPHRFLQLPRALNDNRSAEQTLTSSLKYNFKMRNIAGAGLLHLQCTANFGRAMEYLVMTNDPRKDDKNQQQSGGGNPGGQQNQQGEKQNQQGGDRNKEGQNQQGGQSEKKQS